MADSDYCMTEFDLITTVSFIGESNWEKTAFENNAGQFGLRVYSTEGSYSISSED